MCGRYAATANPDELVLEFEVEEDRSAEPGRSVLVNPQEPPAGRPDHNMAPTKRAPVVLARAPRDDREAPARRQLRLLTWGLVPSWSKDPRGGARMINARVESVADKPAFARALAARRCLVPARGWYEWQASPTALDPKGKPRKQPFFTSRLDGASVAMAGLYEFWRDPTITDPDDPDGVAGHLHGGHRAGRAGPGPHPRPPTARARAGGVGHLARPGHRGGRRARAARAAGSPAASRRTPCRGRSAATGPTGRTCSTRRPWRTSSAWSTR